MTTAAEPVGKCGRHLEKDYIVHKTNGISFAYAVKSPREGFVEVSQFHIRVAENTHTQESIPERWLALDTAYESEWGHYRSLGIP